RRHTRFSRDWSSDVCSSDLGDPARSDGWVRVCKCGDTLTRLTALGTLSRGAGEGLGAAPAAFAAAADEAGADALLQEGGWAEARSEERRVGKECGAGRSAEQ